MKEMMEFILLGDDILIYQEAPENFWHKVDEEELCNELEKREENENQRTN